MNNLEIITKNLIDRGINLVGRILILVFILFIGLKLIKFIQKVVNTALEKSNADKSISTFLSSFSKYTLYGLLAFILASYCGVDAASIVALVGSIGIAVGLALQGSLSNIAGGVLILLLQPFKVGDYIIDHDSHEGVVDNIDIFFTTLKTWDGRTVVLPNGILANNCITNVSTSGERRYDIKLSVGYNTDIDKLRSLITELLNSDNKVIADKDKRVFIDSFKDSYIDVGVRCWFKDIDYWDSACELNDKIKKLIDSDLIHIQNEKIDIKIIN